MHDVHTVEQCSISRAQPHIPIFSPVLHEYPDIGDLLWPSTEVFSSDLGRRSMSRTGFSWIASSRTAKPQMRLRAARTPYRDFVVLIKWSGRGYRSSFSAQRQPATHRLHERWCRSV